MDLGVLPIMKY